jgi:hypothetical protein
MGQIGYPKYVGCPSWFLLFIPKFVCALSALTPMRRRSSLLSLSLCLLGACAIAPLAQAQATATKPASKDWQLPVGAVALVGGAAGVFYLGRRAGQQTAQTATQVQQTFRDYDRIFQEEETPLSFLAPAQAPAQTVVSPTVQAATVQTATPQTVAQTTAPSVVATTAPTQVQATAQSVVQTDAAPALGGCDTLGPESA